MSKPRRRRERRSSASNTPVGIKQPQYSYPPYALINEEKIHLIHERSMQILSEVGIAFYHDEALAILQQNGVTVKDNIAYFDPAHVEGLIAQAPAQFTLQARDPANNVIIGGNYLTFAPVYGPPFTVDMDRGRRTSTLDDLINFIKLTNATPYLHYGGGIIAEPNDIPIPERHLDITYAHIKYGSKSFMGSSIAAESAVDVIQMAEILFGAQSIRQTPAILATINVSSPRRLDDRMLESTIVNARAGQAVMMTPFILSGAMGPVSIAGTVAQLNAEVLAGIAFIQMVNPGTPVIYGSFQTTIDLQSGAPVLGAPESQLSTILSSQLAKHYKLPFRGSGMYASSKIADAQSAYESTMAMLPGIFSQTNFVLHAAGWLENGLAAGYEKFVLDCELLGMYHKYLEGLDFSDDGFAMDSIRDVEPGGHHLGTPHTMKHFRTAFYRAELFDYNSAEQWQEEGSLDAYKRANRKFKTILENYEAPPLDPAVDDALRDFMTRRKAEIAQ